MPADSFLSRWSKRKQESRAGTSDAAAKPAGDAALTRSALVAPAAAAETQTEFSSATAPVGQIVPDAATAETSTSQAKTELPPVESLTPESDFRPFMRPDVDPTVRNQAMKSLFRDPHFNVMDMMDVYVDDYSKPDPIPADMLRQMTQSRMLKLFDDLPEEAETAKQAELPEAGAPADVAPNREQPPQPGNQPDGLPAPEAPEALSQKVTDTTNCPNSLSGIENETQHDGH